MRVNLRVRILSGNKDLLFEAPSAYTKLEGRLRYGGNEVWISLEGNSLSIDLRRLGGRTLLRPDAAMKELSALRKVAEELASSGYTVDLRIRGLKLSTFGRRSGLEDQVVVGADLHALLPQYAVSGQNAGRGRAVYPPR